MINDYYIIHKIAESPEIIRDAILVWPFDKAPEEFRKLSTNGGDEDWLAFVTDNLSNDYIEWLEAGSSFGSYQVETISVTGGVVRIGSHS